jgi:hypothetical protein
MVAFGFGRFDFEQTVEFARKRARISLDGRIGEIEPTAADVQARCPPLDLLNLPRVGLGGQIFYV